MEGLWSDLFDHRSSQVGLPWWLRCKESVCSARDPGSIPELGRSSGEGNGYPLQCSCLENSMDRVMSVIASQAMLRITIMNLGGSRSPTGAVAVVPRDKVGTCTRVALVKVEKCWIRDTFGKQSFSIYSWTGYGVWDKKKSWVIPGFFTRVPERTELPLPGMGKIVARAD